MRNVFPGYYSAPRVTSEFLKDCLVSVDACSLLNLYQFPEQNRLETLKTFASFRDRLWLTNQAVLEFHRGRLSRVSEAKIEVSEAVTELRRFKDRIGKLMKTKHPYVNWSQLSPLHRELEASVNELQKTKHESLDHIGEQIADLFHGKVGKPYRTDALSKVLDDFRIRETFRIPPGFRDSETKSYNAAGDAIIWFQLIDRVREVKAKNVLFVTDDGKDDWWDKSGGLAHPELINEMKMKADADVVFLKLEDFLKSCVNHNVEGLNAEAVKAAALSARKARIDDLILSTDNYSAARCRAVLMEFSPILIDAAKKYNSVDDTSSTEALICLKREKVIDENQYQIMTKVIDLLSKGAFDNGINLKDSMEWFLVRAALGVCTNLLDLPAAKS